MAEQIFIIEDGTLTKYEADDYVEVVYIPDCVKRIGCQAFFEAVVGKDAGYSLSLSILKMLEK